MRGDRSRKSLGWLAFVCTLTLAACSSPGAAAPHTSAAPAVTTNPARYSKVMVITEENQTAKSILGSSQAPYINSLASEYGVAENMNADYPGNCPSLAAYLLMTSGSRHNICDDADPSKHRIMSDNIFQQVAAAGKQWRSYAETMPGACVRHRTSDEVYLSRHVPVTYYASEDSRCQQWALPLGTLTDGALLIDLNAGDLPEYSFVTPNACHDMHGAPTCQTNRVAEGDNWLSQWIPHILQAPDFKAGRLVVIITWDEGTPTDNHITAIVLSPTTRSIHSQVRYNHCSTLRTTEEILALPLLGCAVDASSMRAAFGL